MLREQQREENIDMADCDYTLRSEFYFEQLIKKKNTNSTPINKE